VETALVLPLVLFLILGTLQMFLVLQARVLTEYAVFRAARTGSVAYGNCRRMRDAAVLALLPSYDSFLGRAAPYRGSQTPAEALGRSFYQHRLNRYADRVTDGGDLLLYTGRIVWLRRTYTGMRGGAEESDFDEPNNLQRIEVELTYFYPMKIPFANWVLSAAFLGYSAMNPLSPTHTAAWTPTPSMAGLDPFVAEVRGRAANDEYVMPVRARASMRMMTPLKAANRGTMCL
jgi:hypothetical protein